MKKYVFDSYALIAFFERELGASIVEKVLKELSNNEAKAWLSIINWGEIYYVTYRSYGEAKAKETIQWIEESPLTLIDANKALTWEAAQLKAKYPMAYADCFALALAKQKEAKLLTGDPEFKKVKENIKIIWLK